MTKPRFPHQPRHESLRRRLVADPKQPGALTTLMVAHLEHLAARHYAPTTVSMRTRVFYSFCQWCLERGITDASQVSLSVLERFQRFMAFQYRTRNGEMLSINNQADRLIILKHFFRWCVRGHYIRANPAADVELPRKSSILPRSILSRADIVNLFAQPDLTTLKGIRDRTIMEVFYSTGIRRMELVRLTIDDIQRGAGMVLIREGKRRKDRYVPIGQSALIWLDKYLSDVRPQIVMEPDAGHIFLSARSGQRICAQDLAMRLRDYLAAAEIKKRGSCHLFRHAFATHLLEAGCDVRYIQEMLGHARLETTAIYTNVAITALKTMHATFHPQETGKAGLVASSSAAQPGVVQPDKMLVVGDESGVNS